MRQGLTRAIVIAMVLVTIVVAHHATDPAQILLHVVYQDLCYAPILVAAFWFGLPGGVAAALLAGLGTVTHVYAAWPGNRPFLLSEYGQAVGFVIIGAVAGVLATAERRASRRHEQDVASLEAANAGLRASHEQLRHADRLSSLGEIAAGLAHEIRNPLTGVKGALEIITSRAVKDSPDAEFATLASREIARLDNLISEFLTYARPHDPERRETDIFDVLERVVSLISGESERQGVAMEIHRTVVPAVSVDSEQMAQVFFNIVLNAVQVTPPGGHVYITATADSWTLMIDVQDEGPGIRPEHLTKVFDPFFSTKKAGTGLGLSISQRIAQNHHGRIDILQPDRGTVVRVRLPLRAAHGPADSIDRHATTT